MLTGYEIERLVKKGTITIDPFNESNINPNSYNITLADTLKVYTNDVLDPKIDNPTKDVKIPEEGLILLPGNLYLGTTIENTGCSDYVMCIDGRSSLARLGMMVHLTAGFGDLGFRGHWTFEISVLHKLKIYPNMTIGQIYFEEVTGDIDRYYTGKYMFQEEATASRLYQEVK